MESTTFTRQPLVGNPHQVFIKELDIVVGSYVTDEDLKRILDARKAMENIA